MVGAEWGELNDKKKKKYNDKSAKSKPAYQEKFDKYKKSAACRKFDKDMEAV